MSSDAQSDKTPLAFEVQLKIRKPAVEVFDAVVDPARLNGYFLREGSGPLVAGTTVLWQFPEFDERFPVVVREVVAPQRIVLEWGSAIVGDPDTRVVMTFVALDAENTMVKIGESGWPHTPEGLKASHGNAGGWMHMMAAMKAYLEYGINLREGGAF
ncbi:ATPase [Caulobacter vibrioides]|nr:ATPase [Caulobacter vibrioides]